MSLSPMRKRTWLRPKRPYSSSRTDVPITSTTTSSQLKTARSGRADADAALLGAQRQLSAAQARLDTAQAQVREAEAIYKNTADDVARYKLLMAKDEISAADLRYRRLHIQFRKGHRRRTAGRRRRGRTECPRRAEPPSIRPTPELRRRMLRSNPR